MTSTDFADGLRYIDICTSEVSRKEGSCSPSSSLFIKKKKEKERKKKKESVLPYVSLNPLSLRRFRHTIVGYTMTDKPYNSFQNSDMKLS